MARTFATEIEGLSPERDHERIVYVLTFHEFPWDMTRALEFALYRTFAVPAISSLLAQTGEFTARPQKRYDDTDLLLSEIIEHGYDSERGRAAIRRMNRLHRRFDIANDDFLYVLSTFVFEPIRWIDRFGWRRLTANERAAQYLLWREIGRRMAIERIPPSYDEFEAFNRDYEARHFAPSESNTAVGEAVKAMFLGWFLPRQLHGLGAPFVDALLDPPLLAALGFPEPGAARRRLASAAVRARGRIVRALPERRAPLLRTQLTRRRTYPSGYVLEALGPPDVPPDERATVRPP